MASLERWLGGSPLSVFAKLLFLSLVVGVILAALGLTPLGLMHQFVDAFRSLFGVGLDALRDFGRYILTGAVIVIPLWLVARLMGPRR